MMLLLLLVVVVLLPVVLSFGFRFQVGFWVAVRFEAEEDLIPEV